MDVDFVCVRESLCVVRMYRCDGMRWRWGFGVVCVHEVLVWMVEDRVCLFIGEIIKVEL